MDSCLKSLQLIQFSAYAFSVLLFFKTAAGLRVKNLDIILFACSREVKKILVLLQCTQGYVKLWALVYVMSKQLYVIYFSSWILPLNAVKKDE